LSGVTWYRATPSAGTTAWITPADDIRKTLDFFQLGGLRLGERALRSACPLEARGSRPPPAPDLSTGALAPPGGSVRVAAARELGVLPPPGDNAGMARDNSKARLQLQLALLALDGTRPSGTLQWVSAVAPALTQAAVGAGHWAAGRRQRALAAWASAAGSGLAAWGLGTEAPTRAEMVKNTRPHRDLLRALGTRLPPEAPATAGTQPHLSQRSQNALSALICAEICAQIIFGVRSGLRHPRQLTARAIASETFSTVTYVLAAARAVQRRRPRIAAGRALYAAGSLARLRAASAEPLQ
jgi:hypothetical protein